MMTKRDKILAYGALGVALLCFLLVLNGVYGYTGSSVNITTVAVNDSRVDPSDPVTWLVGPVYNGTTGNPVQNGFSMEFDGVGDFVSDNTIGNLPNEFSITGWVYLIDTDIQGAAITQKQGAGVYNFFIYFSTDRVLHFRTYDGANSPDCLTPAPLSPNQWYFFGAVRDGTNLLLYINDNAPITVADSTWGNVITGVQNTNIGSGVFANFALTGRIDEFTIYNRTLGNGEIDYIRENKVPLNQTLIEVWLDFDTNVLDQGTVGNDGTINGNPQYVRGIRGKADLIFDGTGDQLVTSQFDITAFSTGSMECWFKTTDNNMDLFGWRKAAGYDDYANFQMLATGRIRFYWDEGPTERRIDGNAAVNDGKWHWLSVNQDGTTVTMMIDGVLQTDTEITNMWWQNMTYSTQAVYVADSFNSANNWNGSIGEIKIYNHSLTITQRINHYNGIDAETAWLEIYLDFDGDTTDKSGNGRNATPSGDPEYSDGWAFCPLTSSYNGTISTTVSLVNSTTGLTTLYDTAPATYGNYTVTIYPPTLTSVLNGTYVGFIADQYNITINAAYTENEEDFYTLVTATGESLINGHKLGINDTLIIEGTTYTWSPELNLFYASYTRATPGTLTIDTLTSLNEDTYDITNGALNNTLILTYTEGTLSRLQTDFMEGDWIGAILGEYIYIMGALFFWTALMAIITIGIYNVGGAYVALFAWIMGWGVFAGVVHGQAQIIAYIFILIGMGYAIVKLVLDRRTS